MMSPMSEHAIAPKVARTSPVPPRGKPTPLPVSAPVEVRIPDLRVAGKPMRLGRTADGSMEIPRAAQTIGWYAEGPTPGARGPAVLAAHVTYNGERGAFYDLAVMKKGQRIEVERADGRTAVFTVTSVGQYSKDRFPTVDVYANLDHAGLRLITCAGDYDEKTRRYPDNIVVFAELATVRGPHA
jgi:sortase (surface protein transpeptidase)